MPNDHAQSDRVTDATRESIEALVESRSHPIDIASYLYELIVSFDSSDRPEVLKAVAQRFWLRNPSLAKVDQRVTESELIDLTNKLGATVDSMLGALFEENPSYDVFYGKAWHQVVNNSFLESEKARWFALYYILIDLRFPYFQVDDDLIDFSQEDFDEKRRRLPDVFARLKSVIYRSFTRRSERADQILRIIGSVPEYSDQVFLLSMMLAYQQSTQHLREVVPGGGSDSEDDS